MVEYVILYETDEEEKIEYFDTLTEALNFVVKNGCKTFKKMLLYSYRNKSKCTLLYSYYREE